MVQVQTTRHKFIQITIKASANYAWIGERVLFTYVVYFQINRVEYNLVLLYYLGTRGGVFAVISIPYNIWFGFREKYRICLLKLTRQVRVQSLWRYFGGITESLPTVELVSTGNVYYKNRSVSINMTRLNDQG